jgi:hypothetical protein
MGIAWRAKGLAGRRFLIDAEDGIFGIANAVFEMMLRDAASHRLPEFARQRIRITDMVIELVDPFEHYNDPTGTYGAMTWYLNQFPLDCEQRAILRCHAAQSLVGPFSDIDGDDLCRSRPFTDHFVFAQSH